MCLGRLMTALSWLSPLAAERVEPEVLRLSVLFVAPRPIVGYPACAVCAVRKIFSCARGLELHGRELSVLRVHIVFITVLINALCARAVVAAEIASAEQKKIDAYLEDYYEGVDVVAVVIDNNGVAFDCFVRERQPSLKIRNKDGSVGFAPLLVDGRSLDEKSTSTGIGCPRGTVPYARYESSDIAKYGSLEGFSARYEFADTALAPPSDGVSPATIVVAPGAAFAGITNPIATNVSGISSSHLEVWDGQIDFSSDSSFHMLQVSGDGQYVGAGTTEYASVCGYNGPCTFVHFKSSSGTVCYNQQCGFVGLTSAWAPGSGVTGGSPASRHYLNVRIEYNSSRGWDVYFENYLVGYYPLIFFTGPLFLGQASGWGAGGVVASSHLAYPLTTATDMGSGYHASNANSAELSGLQLRTTSWSPIASSSAVLTVTRSACWSAQTGTSGGGVFVRYGGPGRSFPSCAP